MDREQAIKVLKAILSAHSGEVITYIELVAPNQTNNTLSEGYQIHVKGGTFHSIKDLESRVGKYGLSVKEDGEKIVIYRVACLQSAKQ